MAGMQVGRPACAVCALCTYFCTYPSPLPATVEVKASHAVTPPWLCAPAASWEGLASCYQCLGRFTAALKAYSRALELHPGLPYARIQSGVIHMALASYPEGVAQFEAALGVAPDHPAALLGAAECLAASAGLHSRLGALGACAVHAGCV